MLGKMNSYSLEEILMGALDKEERLWADWYEGGQRRVEGHFVDGQENGVWTYWFKNGQKSSEGRYVKGKQDGCWRFWYSSGQKKKENNWKKGEREGEWIYWDKAGIINKTETYQCDALVVEVKDEESENQDDGNSDFTLLLDSKKYEERTLNDSLGIEQTRKLNSTSRQEGAFDSIADENELTEVLRWFDIFNVTVLLAALCCFFITLVLFFFL